MNLLMEEDGEYAPVMEAAALSAAPRKELDDAIAYAASKSGATSDQIVTWIDAFTSLGKPGLMADIPLSAADCAANLNGSWELTSRFSGGVETACRSEIDCDMDPATGRGNQLMTMLTEVNFFVDPPVTSFFTGLCTSNSLRMVPSKSSARQSELHPAISRFMKRASRHRSVPPCKKGSE